MRQGRRKLDRAGYVVHETGEFTFPERETVPVDFPAIHVALPSEQHTYFHWMFEAVAGLLIAGEYFPRDARVVLRLGLAPFEGETLAALGIAAESLIVLPPERVVRFPELYVLPRPFGRERAGTDRGERAPRAGACAGRLGATQATLRRAIITETHRQRGRAARHTRAAWFRRGFRRRSERFGADRALRRGGGGDRRARPGAQIRCSARREQAPRSFAS